MWYIIPQGTGYNYVQDKNILPTLYTRTVKSEINYITSCMTA